MDFKQTYYYVSACAGSGKTTTAMQSISKGIKLGEKYVVAQPKIALIQDTVSSTRNKTALFGAKIAVITSDLFPRRTHSEFIKAVNDASVDVIFCTHATLLACWNIANKGKWNLIIDEVPVVDQSFQKNLSITYDMWTKAIELQESDSSDAYVVTPAPQMADTVKLWADNESEDEVVAVTQPFFQMLSNRHYRTEITKADWQIAGYDGVAQLHAHGTLLPTIFDGWKRVTVMAANFENSLMYLAWTKMGVSFDEDRAISVKNAKHSQMTGKRARIHYITDKNWSLYRIERAGGFTAIAEALAPHISGPHLWSANNSVDDFQWKADHGKRIPPLAQGINAFRDYTSAVFLAALNNTPSHGMWLEKNFNLTREQVGATKAHEAAYQMIMRTNLRVEEGTDQVDVYVGDKTTADFLCDLLPGSKQNFLDIGIKSLKSSEDGSRTRTRKAVVKSTVDRVMENREKKKALKDRIKSLTDAMIGAQGIMRREELAPMLTFSPSTLSPEIMTEVYDGFDEILDLLREMYQSRFKTKEENLLITGATFDRKKDSETKRGLDAFLMSQVVQLDFDDSEVDPRLASRLFSDFKHVMYNSFNNGRDDLYRYRVFIPLACPVDEETYKLIWNMLAQRVVEAGFPGDKKRSGKKHGLDLSKRTPVSLMYAPCQANKKENSFWIENWNQPMLDPMKMIDQAPDDPPEQIELAAVSNEQSEALKSLMDAINKPRGMNSDKFEAQTLKRKKEQIGEKFGKRWIDDRGSGNDLSGQIPYFLAKEGFTKVEMQEWYNEYFMQRPNWKEHKANFDSQVKKFGK